MSSDSQLTGVLALYSTSRDAFSEEHQRVIEVVARQVTPAVQQAAELQKTRSNVVRDKQTGLPKLESFRDLAAAQIADASQQRPVSLVVIEMPDRDHSSAEPYLSHVVRAVRRSLRAADMLFRHRDTDLVALLLQTDRPTGMSIGNRISQAMIDLKSKDALDLHKVAPAHVSVVSAPEDGTTIDELLQRLASVEFPPMTADRAMDNTPFHPLGAMEILSDQVSELIKTGHFAAASQLLRGTRSGRLTDANLYDTFHAELSFEAGDDDAAMSLAQACLGRHPTGTRLSTASALCQCFSTRETRRPRYSTWRRRGGIVEHEIGNPPPLN